MQQDTTTRRLEILKLEGMGLSPTEIVKEVSKKYGCTERTVYLDYEERDVWQPKLIQMKRALLRVISRHEELFRKAVFQYTQAADTRDKLAALGLMRALNMDAFNFLLHTGAIEHFEQMKEKVKIGSDLDSLLKEYEDSVKRAFDRDVQAYGANEQMDPTQADAETS